MALTVELGSQPRLRHCGVRPGHHLLGWCCHDDLRTKGLPRTGVSDNPSPHTERKPRRSRTLRLETIQGGTQGQWERAREPGQQLQ